MNKTSALLLIAALVSPAAFAKDTLPKDEIGPFGPIPIGILEAHFNQCVEDNKSMGIALVGNYCQCVMSQYYQTLTFQGYMRFRDGIRFHDQKAVALKNKTTAECLADTAYSVGSKQLPF